MGNYFKPWRRKIGVMTLLIALLFMAGWLRSQTRTDEVRIGGNGGTLHLLISANNWIGWIMRYESRHTNPRTLPSFWETEGVSDYTPFDNIGGTGELFSITTPLPYLILPYYIIVLPITFISAFLLLSNPHKSTSKKTLEPIPPR